MPYPRWIPRSPPHSGGVHRSTVERSPAGPVGTDLPTAGQVVLLALLDRRHLVPLLDVGPARPAQVRLLRQAAADVADRLPRSRNGELRLDAQLARGRSVERLAVRRVALDHVEVARRLLRRLQRSDGDDEQAGGALADRADGGAFTRRRIPGGGVEGEHGGLDRRDLDELVIAVPVRELDLRASPAATAARRPAAEAIDPRARAERSPSNRRELVHEREQRGLQLLARPALERVEVGDRLLQVPLEVAEL